MRLVSLNETLIAGVGVRAIHNTCAAFAQAIPFARRSRLNARSRAGPSDPDAGSSDPAAGSLKSRIHTERADQPSSKPVDQRRADGSFPSSKPPALSHSKARSPLSAVHAPSNSLSAPRVSQIPRSRSPETASPILRFPAAASTAPVTQSRTSDDSDWPWRPVPCSNPVMTLESRVIFSRPFQSYFDRWPSAVWLAYIIPGTLIVYGVILPYILPIPPPEEGEGKLVGKVAKSDVKVDRNTPKSLIVWTTLFNWVVMPASMIVILFVAPGTHFMQTRKVQRLLQERIITQGTQTRERIRMISGGHLSTSSKQKGREFDPGDVIVRQLRRHEDEPYLVFETLQASRLSRYPRLKAWVDSYRLDFSDDESLWSTKEDVVLSFNRIEKVFGPIKVYDIPKVSKPRFGEGLGMLWAKGKEAFARK